jgi:hypothetical protein
LLALLKRLALLVDDFFFLLDPPLDPLDFLAALG